MSEIKQLEVTIGNKETLQVTTDLAATTAVCSIVGANVNLLTELDSTLAVDGLSLTIILPISVTMAARNKGTYLQIAWGYGVEGDTQNTRLELKGVLFAGAA